MNCEGSKPQKPILDDLEADDQTLFNSLQQRVLTEQSKRGILISTQTVSLVFQALRDKLSERAERIVSEIRRVLTGTYVEDFDNLLEALKAEWNNRMESAKNIAALEFRSETASLRTQFSHPNMHSQK